MNNTQLAHIGGELLLVGGISFFLNKKIEDLKEQLGDVQQEHNDMKEGMLQLQQENTQLKQVINELMNRTSSIMNHLQPTSNTPDIKPQPSVVTPVKKKKLRRKQSSNTTDVPIPSTRIEPVDDSSDSGDHTLDDGELDNLLEQEFNNMNTSHCENGVCTLIDD